MPEFLPWDGGYHISPLVDTRGVLCYTGCMIEHYLASRPDALFRLDTTTPQNRAGGGDYALAITGASLTSPITGGQLNSVLLSSATLTIPETDTFTLSFLAKPEYDVLQFAGYDIFIEGDIVVQHDGITLARLALNGDKVRMFTVSYSPESLQVTVDNERLDIIPPESVMVDQIYMLDTGGLLDMVSLWNRTPHDNYMSTIYHAHLNYQELYRNDVIAIGYDDLYQIPREEMLAHRGYFPSSEDGTGWTFDFWSDTDVVVNNNMVLTGNTVLEPPNEVRVTGETIVHVVEFESPVVMAADFVDLNLLALGVDAPTHPISRDSRVGTRGTVTVVRKPDAEALASVSFWMEPWEGTIMPGVTMTGGVITGTGIFVNGKAYSGAQLKDNFMLTVNAAFADSFDINASITNFVASNTAYTQAQAQELYESFFVIPKVSGPSDNIGLTDSGVFTIGATWGILSSG